MAICTEVSLARGMRVKCRSVRVESTRAMLKSGGRLSCQVGDFGGGGLGIFLEGTVFIHSFISFFFPSALSSFVVVAEDAGEEGRMC